MSLKVEKLFIYPVKSCGRMEVAQFQIGEEGPQVETKTGLIGDREWMFVDADGKFLTQRTLQKLALIHPVIENEKFFLEIEGKTYEIPLGLDSSSPRRLVSVWGKEVDARIVEGPVNQAASDLLKKPVQLVQFDRKSDRESLLKGKGLGVQTRFTDSQQYLLITQESLQDFNSRMKDSVPETRFRGNILVAGAQEPFAEDNWTYVGNDSVIFESTKACGRCKIITVDQDTGVIPSSEPLQVLSKYRRQETNVFFGQYFLSRSFGENLKTGDLLDIQGD